MGVVSSNQVYFGLSGDQNLLTVKRYNLERYGRRSFSVAGPSLWNALPSGIRNSISLPAFRYSLKTHLFMRRLSVYCISHVLIVLFLTNFVYHYVI